MEWLITAGLVSLVFGILFLFSRETIAALNALLNKPLFYIDEQINKMRVVAGVVLVIIGGWIISVAFAYPSIGYLHLMGIIILFFGLLYLFLPHWLEWLSKFFDQLLLSTDEMVIGARKSLGVILIVVSVYIFYTAYLISK